MRRSLCVVSCLLVLQAMSACAHDAGSETGAGPLDGAVVSTSPAGPASASATKPSHHATKKPHGGTSRSPSASPSDQPTSQPTAQPTPQPTTGPTAPATSDAPTSVPTSAPTSEPPVPEPSEVLPPTETPDGLPDPTGGPGPGTGPLVSQPLPRAATARGRLVAGYPGVLRPTGRSHIVSSGVSPSGDRLQVTLDASSTLSATAVQTVFRGRLSARGFIEKPLPAVGGSQAIAFIRGANRITLTVTPGHRTAYLVLATLRAGS